MYFLYIFVFICLIISFIFSRENTKKSLKLAFSRFLDMLPTLLLTVIFVTLLFFFIPDRTILALLSGENKLTSLFIASGLGSIALMPGFVAFPMCAILLSKGVSYTILSAFTGTLMTVGILTFPLEKEYFGTKITILRNLLSFIISIIVALITGFFYGEY